MHRGAGGDPLDALSEEDMEALLKSPNDPGSAWAFGQAPALMRLRRRRSGHPPLLRFALLVLFVGFVTLAGILSFVVNNTNMWRFYYKYDIPDNMPLPKMVPAGATWMFACGLAGFAAWLVWLDVGLKRRLLQLGLFTMQVVLTGLWVDVQFGWRHLNFAVVMAAFAVIFCVATMVSFAFVQPAAVPFNLPYTLGMIFAFIFSIKVRNRNRDED
eukprot:jgi/Mesvir1/20420/Mv12323-RA.1